MNIIKTTPTGVTLTLIQGFKGQRIETNLDALRDRCYTLKVSLESLRASITDNLTLKQLVKFQATSSKATEIRAKSLPKHLRDAYLETERLRLEYLRAIEEFNAARESIDSNKESEASSG